MNVNKEEMKNRLLTVLLVCVLALFVSCENEKPVSSLPVFSGFTTTWTSGEKYPKAGEVVTITAFQKKPGRLIYNANYSWTAQTRIDGKDSVYTYNKNVVYDYETDHPTFKYKIPAGNNGELTVRFHGSYDFSSSTVEIEPSQHEDGYIGTITTSGTTLVGQASGSFNLTITP